MNETQAIVDAAREAEKNGKTAVLATVVDVQGSAYRRPGARMLVTDDGWQAGSISGGCLEGDIVKRGAWLTQNGPALVTYDTTDDDDIQFGVGLGCRGIVSVFLERVSANCDVISFLENCQKSRRFDVLATVFDGENFGGHFTLDSSFSDLTAAMRDVTASGQSETRTVGASQIFLEVVHPPVSLIVFGAGHDAKPLVSFAKALGWHVTVCDGRPSYLTPARFPDADILTLCLPDALSRHVLLDENTLAVVMSHHYLTDLALLRTLLPSPVRYLGLLGPKSRAEQLLADLREENVTWTDEQAERLHAPVGLDIGADTPESVALAMLAEMSATLKNRDGGKLREREASIHPETQTDWKTARTKPNGCASAL